jgi:hypothetical protein
VEDEDNRAPQLIATRREFHRQIARHNDMLTAGASDYGARGCL